MQSIELRTGIWYNDHAIQLDFPDSWDVQVSWPQTPDPLTDEQIKQTLETPIGQPPLRELAKGMWHQKGHVLAYFIKKNIEPQSRGFISMNQAF